MALLWGAGLNPQWGRIPCQDQEEKASFQILLLQLHFWTSATFEVIRNIILKPIKYQKPPVELFRNQSIYILPMVPSTLLTGQRCLSVCLFVRLFVCLFVLVSKRYEKRYLVCLHHINQKLEKIPNIYATFKSTLIIC